MFLSPRKTSEKIISWLILFAGPGVHFLFINASYYYFFHFCISKWNLSESVMHTVHNNGFTCPRVGLRSEPLYYRWCLFILRDELFHSLERIKRDYVNDRPDNTSSVRWDGAFPIYAGEMNTVRGDGDILMQCFQTHCIRVSRAFILNNVLMTDNGVTESAMKEMLYSICLSLPWLYSIILPGFREFAMGRLRHFDVFTYPLLRGTATTPGI